MSPDLSLRAIHRAARAPPRAGEAAAFPIHLAVVVLGVLLLHIAFVVWLGRAGTWRASPDRAARSMPMAVRMLGPADPPTSPGAVSTPSAAVARSSARPPALRQAAPRRAIDSAPTGPRTASPTAMSATERVSPPGPLVRSTATDAASPTPSTSTNGGGASTASGKTPALDLRLPRRDPTRPTAHNPALDDPRAHTARTTVEQRMARTFDTRVIEEALGDGRMRIRQGDRCVIVLPSRQSELFAGDGSGGPAPRQVMDCP